MKLYCATGNLGKLREFRMAADHAPVEIELLPRYGEIPPCMEDFQYVFNPGAGLQNPNNTDRRIGDEAVIGLRTVVTF